MKTINNDIKRPKEENSNHISKVNKVKIPLILKIRIGKTEEIMKYKRVGKVNDTLYLYENIKTGCKQCFSIYDFIEMANRNSKLTYYERCKRRKGKNDNS